MLIALLVVILLYVALFDVVFRFNFDCVIAWFSNLILLCAGLFGTVFGCYMYGCLFLLFDLLLYECVGLLTGCLFD